MKIANEWKEYKILDMADGQKLEKWGDIILSRPDNPNKTVWIIQAKNTMRPLGNPDIIEELLKFECSIS
mgnify:CR=1 FL=1